MFTFLLAQNGPVVNFWGFYGQAKNQCAPIFFQLFLHDQYGYLKTYVKINLSFFRILKKLIFFIFFFWGQYGHQNAYKGSFLPEFLYQAYLDFKSGPFFILSI